jgi:ABC-type Mn2+/Zn2+ transport system ATPase subunit
MSHIDLSLHEVTVTYGETIALEDVTLDIEAGEFVGVVGPNGAGKSTMLNAILGLVPLAHGEIRVHDRPIGEFRHEVSYMPQREMVDWTFPITVQEVVMMGRENRIGWFRRPRPRDRERVEWALKQVEMWTERLTPIGKLSGGQQQRVFLARALAQEGMILLLDEPMTGVDAPTQETILKLLQDFRAQGRTVVMTTHDLGVARAFCSKLLFLHHTAVAFGAPAETFTTQVLEKTYGGHVLRVSGEEPGELLDDAMLILRDDTHHRH